MEEEVRREEQVVVSRTTPDREELTLARKEEFLDALKVARNAQTEDDGVWNRIDTALPLIAQHIQMSKQDMKECLSGSNFFTRIATQALSSGLYMRPWHLFGGQGNVAFGLMDSIGTAISV
eukprot:COSAG01_NODE_19797_length_988_cov_10.285714_1_plen_121_part_00